MNANFSWISHLGLRQASVHSSALHKILSTTRSDCWTGFFWFIIDWKFSPHHRSIYLLSVLNFWPVTPCIPYIFNTVGYVIPSLQYSILLPSFLCKLGKFYPQNSHHMTCSCNFPFHVNSHCCGFCCFLHFRLSPLIFCILHINGIFSFSSP